MPKSRTRLTRKKTAKRKEPPLGCEKNAPTAADWVTMKEYQTFEVSDEDDKVFSFSKDEIALIFPNGRKIGNSIETHEHWVCRILEIRAKDEMDVWVQVAWFYSAQDAAREVPTFDPSHCGQYERLKSNHIDYLSSSVFDGMATMKEYDERSLEQDGILEDDFYYRYTIDVVDKSISPVPSTTCICTFPYNPSDTHPDALMHFCPQPACRKYYHSGCIAPKSAPPAAQRDLGFLLRDPTTGLPLELSTLSSASQEPPKKRRRASEASTELSPVAHALLAALPPALVRAAAQSIVRGGAFPAGGVAGNVTAVLAARRIVFEALRDGRVLLGDGWQAHMPDRWQALVDVKLDRDKTIRGKGKGKAKNAEVLALECPACGGPI